LADPVTKKKMSEYDQGILTKVFLNGDVGSLMDKYTWDELKGLIGDQTVLKTAIKDLESQLAGAKYSTYYTNQADALGMYMATGRASNTGIAKNAHGIASVFGVDNEVASAADVKKYTPIIDTLASLRALDHMPMAYKTSAEALMLKQDGREDGVNGIEFIMHQHNALKKESLKALFSGDPALATKGYTYEITNPYLSVEYAEAGSPDADALLSKGYKEVLATKRDKLLDPEKHKLASMYVIEDGGQVSYLTGAMSLTNMVAKGTSFTKAGVQVGNDASNYLFNADLAKMKTQAATANANLLTTRVSASANEDVHLIPIYNPMGTVVDYRYEMSEDVRSLVLEKDYKVGNILGSMAGSIVDKVSTEKINVQTIEALHDQFSSDTAENQRNYLTVGPDSADPELRELWQMLPHGAKEAAQSKFGLPSIKVKKELLNLAFGYRKASVGNMWTMPPHKLNMFQKYTKEVLDKMVGPVRSAKIGNALRTTENIAQTLVKMIKDIYVVKNFFTTMGNMISNTALLQMSGISPLAAIRDQIIGWRAAQKYNILHKELYTLENEYNVMPGSPARKSALLNKIKVTKHKLAGNPVHELMEAGLFQTIVEDIDASEDPFSYKTKFMKKLDKKVGRKIHPDVKTFGKYLFVTQDSKAYRFMNQPIQLSDFSARYAQYKHLTEVQTKKMGKEEALLKVSENFINYDIPTNKGIQYLNDVGLLMFTKYFLRIQKPIFNLFLERPMTSIINIMLQSIMSMSNPVDSSFLNTSPLSRFHDPFTAVIDAPDEIAPFNAALHLTGFK